MTKEINQLCVANPEQLIQLLYDLHDRLDGVAAHVHDPYKQQLEQSSDVVCALIAQFEVKK